MPASTPTLRDMVNGARDRGQTYKQLAERAIDPETGQRASLAFLNDIARGKVDRMPYDYHLRALAAALGVPYEHVRQAAIRQWVPPDAPGQVERAMLDQASRLEQEAQELRRLAGGRPDPGDAAAGRESA